MSATCVGVKNELSVLSIPAIPIPVWVLTRPPWPSPKELALARAVSAELLGVLLASAVGWNFGRI